MLIILPGDVLEQLATLPDNSVHCVISSPPYWGLRSYLPKDHPLKRLEIGSEKTIEEYVSKMVQVFREVRRVLRLDGTCWINLGDSYNSIGHKKSNSGYGTTGLAGGKAQEHSPLHRENADPNLKHKDLCGIPWRVAFALQSDGWWLRQDIVWAKPNPMPESVTDRCTKSHEYIFLLSKSATYFYDAEAIKEPQSAGTHERYGKNSEIPHKRKHGEAGSVRNNLSMDMALREAILEGGRNKRSVWSVPSQAYPESHFATFPEDLIKPCILAGTSARGCCPKCGAPWERVLEKVKGTPDSFNGSDFRNGKKALSAAALADVGQQERTAETKTLSWQPTCECNTGNPIPCTILDPFFGSGCTGAVSLELGRKCIGIELSPDYIKLAEKRCNVTPGLPLA